MSAPSRVDGDRETVITVRYWASARAAAGVSEDRIPVETPLSVTEIRSRSLELHAGSERLGEVLAVCSVLVDDLPVGSRDPDEVLVEPGSTVEFLPPFAGG